MKLLLDNVPQILSKSFINELQKSLEFLNGHVGNKIIFEKIIEKYSKNKDSLFIENNIIKTLNNIDEDINKDTFTGKELKEIITNQKMQKYSISVLNIFKEISELATIKQISKENSKLIENIDIFTIIYIAKNIETLSENTVLKEQNTILYENKIQSIFEEDIQIANPFLNFLNLLNVDMKMEALIDKQSIDNLFYID